jgi:hypothetical protein
VTFKTKSYQVIGRVITPSAAWLNVMDLKIFHAPARLATPSVTRQDLPAELPISFWVTP